MSDFVQQQNTVCDFSTSDSWVILSPIEQSIKRKIEAVGTPLKDWDIQINYGIKTGCNEAFIINTAKRVIARQKRSVKERTNLFDHFKRTIQAYLDNRVAEDELFAANYLKEGKNNDLLFLLSEKDFSLCSGTSFIFFT